MPLSWYYCMQFFLMTTECLCTADQGGPEQSLFLLSRIISPDVKQPTQPTRWKVKCTSLFLCQNWILGPFNNGQYCKDDIHNCISVIINISERAHPITKTKKKNITFIPNIFLNLYAAQDQCVFSRHGYCSAQVEAMSLLCSYRLVSNNTKTPS